MIQHLCDLCGELVADEDMAPIGGGNPLQRLGFAVQYALSSVDTVTVSVGPVSVNGKSNSNHWHKECVRRMVAEGAVQ